MLTSKQISYLRKLSVEEPDIIFIGKDGVTDEIIMEAKVAIKARELIKGKIQKNSMETPLEAANMIAESIKCDVVCTIGNKFVLYKCNAQKPKIKLPKQAKKKVN